MGPRCGGRAVGTALVAALVAAVPAGSVVFGQEVGSAAALQEAILRAKERVLPAVVNIQPVTELFVAGAKREVTAVGSGIIYSPRGYVLTNYHIAGKATRLICTLFNKERVPARLVGGDPYTDLAVIQLDLDRLKGNTLSWATLGDSDAIQTGEFVLALGSPLALSHSLSVGVVSAKDRYLPDMVTQAGEVTGSYNTWIQTDAAINPGNSGGPLVNLRGQVIGINARRAAYGENLGFAIPSNVARAVAEELVAKGKVTRSWVGLWFQPLQDFEEYLSAGRPAPEGVLVRGVEPGSPAEAAGLKAGDIVTAYDGRKVDAPFHEDIPLIRNLIARTEVGRRVTIAFRRGDVDGQVTLVTEELGRGAVDSDFECKAWGCTVRPVTPDLARRLGLADAAGVLVTGVKANSPAARAGLAQGDILVQADRQDLKTLAAFRDLYEQLSADKRPTILLKAWRGGGVTWRLLKIEDETPPAKSPEAPAPTSRPAPEPAPTTGPAFPRMERMEG